ncbi:MAG: sigma-70 family RNA polymerase sigma factor [Planctomycetota bacterium]
MAELRLANQTLTREEFERLYREAYPTLRVVASAVASRAFAEDIVQQAAIVALQRLDRFEPGTNFKAWMSAIVRGAAKNQRRSERRHRDRILKSADPGDGTESAGGASGGGRRSIPGEIPGEIEPELRNALASLGPQQRTCILLKALFDHSYDEIAAIVGIPSSTARSHVHRGRKKLAEILGDSKGMG